MGVNSRGNIVFNSQSDANATLAALNATDNIALRTGTKTIDCSIPTVLNDEQPAGAAA